VFCGPGKVLLEKVRVVLDGCFANFFRIEVAVGTLSTAERDVQIKTSHVLQLYRRTFCYLR
jgi:hypothetical protein